MSVADQVQSLFAKNSRITVTQANKLYEIPNFTTVSGRSISLSVQLPVGFPDTPPVLTATGAAGLRHELLDPQGTGRVTNFVGLQHWYRHDDLGTTVKATVEQLSNNLTIGGGGGGGGGLTQPPAFGVGTGGQGTDEFELDGIPTEDLRRLAEDEAAFQAYFQGLRFVQSAKAKEEDLVAENVQLAQENLALQQPLETKRAELIKRHLAFGKLKAEYEAKAAEAERLRRQYSTESIRDNLSIAAAQAEADAKAALAQFNGGQLSVGEFKDRYLEARQLFHLRDLKRAEFAKLCA